MAFGINFFRANAHNTQHKQTANMTTYEEYEKLRRSADWNDGKSHNASSIWKEHKVNEFFQESFVTKTLFP